MAEIKRITLHPVLEDGTVDLNVNLYPKTLLRGIVDDTGEEVEVALKEDIPTDVVTDKELLEFRHSIENDIENAMDMVKSGTLPIYKAIDSDLLIKDIKVPCLVSSDDDLEHALILYRDSDHIYAFVFDAEGLSYITSNNTYDNETTINDIFVFTMEPFVDGVDLEAAIEGAKNRFLTKYVIDDGSIEVNDFMSGKTTPCVIEFDKSLIFIQEFSLQRIPSSGSSHGGVSTGVVRYTIDIDCFGYEYENGAMFSLYKEISPSTTFSELLNYCTKEVFVKLYRHEVTIVLQDNTTYYFYIINTSPYEINDLNDLLNAIRSYHNQIQFVIEEGNYTPGGVVTESSDMILYWLEPTISGGINNHTISNYETNITQVSDDVMSIIY